MLYFGTTLGSCFGETLARFRPDAELIALVGDEWRDMGFMEIGSVPAEWRHRRLIVRARVALDLPFLDVEDLETIQALREPLARHLATWGYRDLDIGLMRGPDRRVTRAVSYWTWSQKDDRGGPRYAGVRYLSRLSNEWECWAVFHDMPIEELEKGPIPFDLEPMTQVAAAYSLMVH